MLMKIHKTGQYHKKAHRPCQDYCKILQTDSMLLLLAADGHGGSAYSRSGLGARIACQAAAKVLSDVSLPVREYKNRIKELFDHYVKKHLKLHPLTADALLKLEGAPPEYAYGTTLLAARITEKETVLFQIGDGDIHAIRKNGTLFPMLPKDSNCIGSYTSSLVTPDAPANMRILSYPGKAGCILLHSDGFEPDMSHPWQLLSSIGPDFTYEQLKKAANDGGQRGDDQTILLYYDEAVVASASYQEGLGRTIRHYELYREMEQLARRQRELESYLETAMELLKTRQGETREQLLKKMKPRYTEYMTVKTKLWTMKMNFQSQHLYHMYPLPFKHITPQSS